MSTLPESERRNGQPLMQQTSIAWRVPMSIARSLVSFSVLAFTGSVAMGQVADHPPHAPLKAAIDVGYAPFAMKNAAGESEGFNVDIARDLAKRLKRPGLEIVDTRWNVTLSGLFSKRYEIV